LKPVSGIPLGPKFRTTGPFELFDFFIFIARNEVGWVS
jgi:hypothetical protein